MTEFELFEYDENQSYEANYSKWRLMNNDERMQTGDKELTEKQAIKIFKNLHGKRNTNKPVNIIYWWQRTNWKKDENL